MIFIETTFFTKHLVEYLTDDEYSELQNYLVDRPNSGVIIQGTGGLRKLRWSSKNKSKRDGVRVIYYWQVSEDHLYMMTLYSKNEISNLSAADKKALKKIISGW